MSTDMKRYIIMPDYGYRGREMRSASLSALLTNQHGVSQRPGSRETAHIALIDEISNHGPKLVELSDEGRAALQAAFGGSVKIVPLQTYPSPRRPYQVSRAADHAADTQGLTKPANYVQVLDEVTGEPLKGARVLAFTLFRHREGIEGVTDARGVFALEGLTPGKRLDRLIVYGPAGYWGHFQSAVPVKGRIEVRLMATQAYPQYDVIRQLFGDLPADVGRSVRVGIIDTGVAPNHPALSNVRGGRNCVLDEYADDADLSEDWHDVDGHGTHVAGIVGSQGVDGSFRGVAPGVELRSYRVFSAAADGAINYDIMRAIDFAVADECDIINLSLGMPVADDAVRGAIGDAAEAGVLVVAAAGNDGRKPVSYPAAYGASVAVSAIGVRGSFPPNSSERGHESQPSSPIVPAVFVAGFTNTGPQIKITGPGVGVVSTLKEGGFGPMSGTSMASPAIAGFAAYLLAADLQLASMPRSPERRIELTKRLYSACASLGLSGDLVGAGLPLANASKLVALVGQGSGPAAASTLTTSAKTAARVNKYGKREPSRDA